MHNYNYMDQSLHTDALEILVFLSVNNFGSSVQVLVMLYVLHEVTHLKDVSAGQSFIQT